MAEVLADLLHFRQAGMPCYQWQVEQCCVAAAHASRVLYPYFEGCTLSVSALLPLLWILYLYFVGVSCMFIADTESLALDMLKRYDLLQAASTACLLCLLC